MRMHLVWEHPRRPEEGAIYPIAAVTALFGCWEPHSGLLGEQHVLLTAPSLTELLNNRAMIPILDSGPPDHSPAFHSSASTCTYKCVLKKHAPLHSMWNNGSVSGSSSVQECLALHLLLI